MVKRVRSISELVTLAKQDPQYRDLLICASENLGGPPNATSEQAASWLRLNAQETSESGVVAEINYCRDLV